MDFRFSKYLERPDCRDDKAICAQMAAFGFPVQQDDGNPDNPEDAGKTYSLFLGYEHHGAPYIQRTTDLQVWWHSFVDRVYFVLAHQVRINYVFDAWASCDEDLRSTVTRWLADDTKLPLELYLPAKPWVSMTATLAAGVADQWAEVLVDFRPHILFAPQLIDEEADIRQQVMHRIALHEQGRLDLNLALASPGSLLLRRL